MTDLRKMQMPELDPALVEAAIASALEEWESVLDRRPAEPTDDAKARIGAVLEPMIRSLLQIGYTSGFVTAARSEEPPTGLAAMSPWAPQH